MEIDLIVFDCDGVLVDSEALVARVEADLLREAGFEVTAEQLIERYVGLTYSAMMAGLAADHGRPVPPELEERIRAVPADRFASELEPVPGIGDLLASLDGERCVASASGFDRIRRSLEVCGLAHHFRPERIFSSDMVARPKPAPDLFVYAAGQVGVDPARCVVVEDSTVGVQAARAAGMLVVGFTGGGHATPALAEHLRKAGAAEICADTAALARHVMSRTSAEP